MTECRIEIDGVLPRAIGLTKAKLRAAAQTFAARSAARIQMSFRAVTIILQDDDASAAVHEAINGVAGATDVVTQPYDALPGEAPGVYGELYVNTDQALREGARRKGWSPQQELLLYVAHGMDHLSGASDLDEKGYKQMRRRELGWLKKLVLGALLLTGFAVQGGDLGWDALTQAVYVEPMAQFVFPQGGGNLRQLSGASFRLGANVDAQDANPNCSAALEVSVLENTCGLAWRHMWSLQGWEWFGKMFGYERFDPYVSLGLRGWINDGDVGPCAGVGFLYYLDDHWAIKAEVDTTLGLERDVEAIHTLSVGLQYLF